MTCHRTAQAGGQVDSTHRNQANAVRLPSPKAMGDERSPEASAQGDVRPAFPLLLSDLLETRPAGEGRPTAELAPLLERRHVALMLRKNGERTGPVHAAEVLCDLPGGRALTQILGTSVCFWAAQSSVARLVVAEVQ